MDPRLGRGGAVSYRPDHHIVITWLKMTDLEASILPGDRSACGTLQKDLCAGDRCACAFFHDLSPHAPGFFLGRQRRGHEEKGRGDQCAYVTHASTGS